MVVQVHRRNVETLSDGTDRTGWCRTAEWTNAMGRHYTGRPILITRWVGWPSYLSDPFICSVTQRTAMAAWDHKAADHAEWVRRTGAGHGRPQRPPAVTTSTPRSPVTRARPTSVTRPAVPLAHAARWPVGTGCRVPAVAGGPDRDRRCAASTAPFDAARHHRSAVSASITRLRTGSSAATARMSSHCCSVGIHGSLVSLGTRPR